MLRLRAAVTVLAVALVVTGWSLGDDKKDTPPPRGTLPQHYKKIGLTDEQREAVLRVRGGYRAKIDALKRQISQLQRDEKEELEKLLTDAQKARLRELRSGEPSPKDKGTGKDKSTGKPSVKDKAPDKKS
jgi:hypothetical protein